VVASFALTGPAAGSHPSDLTTTARRDGDHWILYGTKRYITNAQNPLAAHCSTADPLTSANTEPRL
jgi:alkylation response protein AidB-like acyl-CoA dehydrogenase